MDGTNSNQPPAMHQTTTPNSMASRKKRRVDDTTPGAQSSTTKAKACSTCRRLKIRCDSGEREMGSCSRCLRLGLQCINERRSWVNAATNEEQQQHSSLVIFRLERALEDVLEKLNMPVLEMYAQPAIVGSMQSPRPTRPSSREPAVASDTNGERDVSPGPMRSLIEATRLNGLSSQLRSSKQRRKGGMRRMDSDIISERLLSKEDAEEMLNLFKIHLSHHLYSATIPDDTTLEDIRTSSTILFLAIMLVSSLHIPGREVTHELCHRRFLGLVSAAIFDRFHTLDDIRGLCIAAFWQPDLSWKLSGLCVRMATELNLHHAFYEAFYTPNISDDARRESLEKTRLWYLLYVLDHQSSIAYGRPPVMTELRPIKDFEVFLHSPWCTLRDQAMLAQVTGFVMLDRAFETFGLEPQRTMDGDDASVLDHCRFTEVSKAWRERWGRLDPAQTGEDSHDLSGAVKLHHHFSELLLNSLVLRGRPLGTLQDLPFSLRPLTLRAIEAAHAILEHFINEPGYHKSIFGVPIYVHSIIAFAVVFLMKLSRRWHVIGITIDPAQRTRPLIDGVVKLLRSLEAGSNHIVFSMAEGFERMLNQASRQFDSSQSSSSRHIAQSRVGGSNQRDMIDRSSWENHQPHNNQVTNPSPSTQTSYQTPEMQSITSNGRNDASYRYPVQSSLEPGAYENVHLRSEDLWSLVMGYDLLAPTGEDVTNADFPFMLYDNN